ncbi:hypothetical protein AB8613_23975 [Vibrio sp. BS-M-Sm-2]|uniref:hypothetical protein n=1 Tax=Vibrio sp. BS-M-Sm-2 TaxID=3241167 RepID=UPI0035578782
MDKIIVLVADMFDVLVWERYSKNGKSKISVLAMIGHMLECNTNILEDENKLLTCALLLYLGLNLSSISSLLIEAFFGRLFLELDCEKYGYVNFTWMRYNRNQQW